jgi:hypothetical protein
LAEFLFRAGGFLRVLPRIAERLNLRGGRVAIRSLEVCIS